MKAKWNEVVDCEYNFLEIFISVRVVVETMNNSVGIGNDDGSVAILAIADGTSLYFQFLLHWHWLNAKYWSFRAKNDNANCGATNTSNNKNWKIMMWLAVSIAYSCWYHCIHTIAVVFVFVANATTTTPVASPSAVVVIIIEFRNHLCAIHTRVRHSTPHI